MSELSAQQFELNGYSAIEPIYLGSRTLVYRAVRNSDRASVILKRLRDETPTVEEQTQFRNQYVITKDLAIPGIVRVIGLESGGNGEILVMEDFGGISLSEFFRRHRLSIAQFLSIAVQLSETLYELHQARIIHKDIKPANILIRPDSMQVRLIDFSIASQLSHQTQELQHPNQLEGTLAYLSPEQTGRMNRSVDYRSDFYSLGITFYELLTGQVPFMGKDALEIVYGHLAKEPTAIRLMNPEVPEAIEQIIQKLMAKNAEDRYQSAKGLQADLEYCLEQWKTTGTIAAFEIGKLDRMAQFNIPEKLYGRETQVKILLDAFERARQGSAEFVVVSGYSGIGKTALIRELFKPMTESNAHFVSGKFEQFKRDIPYACLAEAYRGLIQQILAGTAEKIEFWRDRFQTALGSSAQLVIDVIPELELLIGKQPSTPELSPTEAQTRFEQSMFTFMTAASCTEYPAVEFMDDLQWADLMSITSLKSSMQSPANRYRLIVVAYRDNEVDPTHPLAQTLSQMQSEGIAFEQINLAPLSLYDVMQLVADTLQCHFSKVQPLAKLLHDKTQGNPFFITELLKSLHAEELLKFNLGTNAWHWDLKLIQQRNITENVVELMIANLKRLPSHAQTVLKLAACIGSQFDLKTLSIVNQQSTTRTLQSLWDAIQQGFILPLDKSCQFGANDSNELQTQRFRFLHDRVQQAAYELIDEDQKQATHLMIGQLLYERTPETERESNIFTIVGHLNTAINLVSDREELARLNYLAGRKAKSSIAYDFAQKHYSLALSLLTDTIWQTDYEFALKLHEEAIEIAYLCGDFEQMQQRAKWLFAHTKTVQERIKIYELQISAQIVQGNPQTAIVFALEILEQLGISLPTSPTAADVEQLQAEIAAMLPPDLMELTKLPQMTDANSLAASQILISIYSASFVTNQFLFAQVVMTMVKLSLIHGNSALSACAYVGYGCLLVNYFDQPALSYQSGCLGLTLAEQFGDRCMESMSIHIFATFVLPQNRALQEAVSLRERGMIAAIESSNPEILGWHYVDGSHDLFFLSRTLPAVETKIAGYVANLEQYNQRFQLLCVQSLHQMILNLLEPSENPWLLVGKTFDEVTATENATEDMRALLGFTYTFKLMLCCFFDQAILGLESAKTARLGIRGLTGNTVWHWFHFYESLAHLMAFDSLPETEQAQALEQVAVNQPILERLASRAPMNYQAKLDLVNAEQCRVMKQYEKAIGLYDRAITGALENGFIQEAAFANELAAKFYFKLNKSKIAQVYLREAYQQYEQWGAIAKLRQLEVQYPSYLLFPTSIHQTRSSTSTSTERLDLATIIKATEAISSELVLDQLLDRLLHIILENAGAQKGCIILDRAGELFIEVADTNQDASEVIVEAIPLAQSQDFPLSILNYVARTQQAIVSIDATTESICASDPYVLKHSPKSLLCTPILYQGKFIGLVYLENNLVKGAFTHNRLETVKILMGQAAIALENARLFTCIQEKATELERSESRLSKLFEQSADATFIFDPQQLKFTKCNQAAIKLLKFDTKEQLIGLGPGDISPEFQPDGRPSIEVAIWMTALVFENGSHRFEWLCHTAKGEPIWLEIVLTLMSFDDQPIFHGIWRDLTERKQAEAALRDSQAQLIQAEKMSALGNLVAGVAHEINNPIGFLNGSISNAKDFVQDIFTHLELCEQQFPNDATMSAHAEEIDLEFVKADLPKLLNSMKTAVDRIKSISHSLRTFSRADTENAIVANIHEGIDSTLMILKYRLKANEYRPEIKVITNYGTIPNIECFPGQLNQVFMNIFANAIDMFDESQDRQPQMITIQTAQVDQNAVEIRIRDNGKGMPDEVKAKVFEHLFTTKVVGKGTGLGLSIARQIIVEKHQGSIAVNSTIDEGSEFVISLPINQNP
ncbi:ATP-binding sensor histidine kinase [Leptolyngbya sp. AN03gr2]|uniref:ATP-binding sensor histidine kinase n=1 Tax=unclassified Leptolyngbya TaxID=2650499 RepID=UPI003D31FCE6